MDEQNFERRTLNELILNEQREMKKDLNSRMDRIEISKKFISSLELQNKILTSSIVALVIAVIYSVVK